MLMFRDRALSTGARGEIEGDDCGCRHLGVRRNYSCSGRTHWRHQAQPWARRDRARNASDHGPPRYRDRARRSSHYGCRRLRQHQHAARGVIERRVEQRGSPRSLCRSISADRSQASAGHPSRPRLVFGSEPAALKRRTAHFAPHGLWYISRVRAGHAAPGADLRRRYAWPFSGLSFDILWSTRSR